MLAANREAAAVMMMVFIVMSPVRSGLNRCRFRRSLTFKQPLCQLRIWRHVLSRKQKDIRALGSGIGCLGGRGK
jgi:hypothetical protein